MWIIKPYIIILNIQMSPLGFDYKKHVAFVVGDQLAKASKQG